MHVVGSTILPQNQRRRYVLISTLMACVSAAGIKAVIRIITISTKIEEQRKDNITLFCVCNYTDQRSPVVEMLLDQTSPIGLFNALCPLCVSNTACKSDPLYNTNSHK